MKKICSKCNKEYLISNFYRDKYKKDGYKSYCKTCDSCFPRKIDKEYRNMRIRKRLAYNRDEMNDSYWSRISRRHKQSAEFFKNLYHKQSRKCYYCKVDVIASNLHVDHYYPQKDIKLVISCCDCNRLKWQKSGDEFLEFIKTYILRFS